MKKGIYCYIDKKDGSIVYIGKDSNIKYNKRHKAHLATYRYNEQVINRVLQNNPNRYKYEILKSGDFSKNLLCALEILYIRRYNPKFNYTVGGDGATGRKCSEETKRKIGLSHKGKNGYWKGKSRSEETKQKISENNAKYWKGKKHSEETKRKIGLSHKGKKLSNECKKKMSESHTKKYARIIKSGKMRGRQRYQIIKDGKTIKQSFYPSKLLKWFTKEYPNEILEIKINGGNLNG